MRDDGHPCALLGLWLSVPLGLLAALLLVRVPLGAVAPRLDVPGRWRDRRAERAAEPNTGDSPEEYAAVRREELIRRRRDKAGFLATRAVPSWVVTGELRRLRAVAVILIGTGVGTYALRTHDQGYAGTGTAIGALGGVVLVCAVYAIDRRRRDAARIHLLGPDEADTLDSARERARPPAARCAPRWPPCRGAVAWPCSCRWSTR